MTLVRAKYKRSGESCYVNMNYVVDIFDKGPEIMAYTFDNDRGGYVISRAEFEMYLQRDREE